MKSVKVLFIEDEEPNIELYTKAVKKYNNEFKDLTIEEEFAKSETETINKLSNEIYEIYIIDLKLKGDAGDYSGKKIVRTLNCYSPGSLIIIYSANTSQVDEGIKRKNNVFIEQKKSTIRMYTLLKKYLEIYQNYFFYIHNFKNTLFSRFNYQKIIELSNIFDVDEVIKNSDIENKDKIKSRIFVSQVLEAFTNAEDKYHVLEFYSLNKDLFQNKLINGSILKKDKDYYLLITPQCSLNSTSKINNYSLCRILSYEGVFNGKKSTYCLPDCDIFDLKSKYIDFTDLFKIEKSESILDNYLYITLVKTPFIDDILSCFSSFYKKRGVPEILKKS